VNTKQVRFRKMASGDYHKEKFQDCIHIDDNVHVVWIDFIDDELVITTSEECIVEDSWLKPKPKICPYCKQVMEKEKEEE
jgi:hypothetical protein